MQLAIMSSGYHYWAATLNVMLKRQYCSALTDTYVDDKSNLNGKLIYDLLMIL